MKEVFKHFDVKTSNTVVVVYMGSALGYDLYWKCYWWNND